jgi:hypothetical protein
MDGSNDIDMGGGGMDSRVIPDSINYANVPDRAVNHEGGITTLFPVGTYSSQADSIVRFNWK